MLARFYGARLLAKLLRSQNCCAYGILSKLLAAFLVSKNKLKSLVL